MDCSDWPNRIRYHIIDTRPDTEVKLLEPATQAEAERRLQTRLRGREEERLGALRAKLLRLKAGSCKRSLGCPT
jgi:hypothetical protein